MDPTEKAKALAWLLTRELVRTDGTTISLMKFIAGDTTNKIPLPADAYAGMLADYLQYRLEN